MILEANKSHYRGVSCARCGTPIPISAKVHSLQDEVDNEETNAARSFTSRCRCCEEESIYTVTAIQEFEGEPRTRRLRPHPPRSRTAKA
jgi:hypothetical protein